MPRVDGMTFYRELERRCPHMARRVMFVTGDVAGTEAERFLEETRLPLARRSRSGCGICCAIAREMLG